MPESINLKAGHLSVHYQDGFIRHIFCGTTEIVRMIYAAVRDQNWGTVIPVIENESIEKSEDHFKIDYDARYEKGEIQFQAIVKIMGKKNNSIEFYYHGEAKTPFCCYKRVRTSTSWIKSL